MSVLSGSSILVTGATGSFGKAFLNYALANLDPQRIVVFSRDELLTWISAYWFSGAIGTSFTPYAESGAPPARIPQPAVFTIFPADLVNAPREFAERFFDVRSWSEEEHGGHFAAWECPEVHVAGVRRAVALF